MSKISDLNKSTNYQVNMKRFVGRLIKMCNFAAAKNGQWQRLQTLKTDYVSPSTTIYTL